MSVLGGLSTADFTIAGDGLLELSEERLRSIMRTEPITDVYHVEQTPFARGKFASVRKIRHLVTGVEYAAKFIRKRRRAADSSREIQHEVAVLALCSGTPRVVRMHEVYETRAEVAIVLELACGGELQRVLDEEERLEEGAARRALRHVLEGLAHLHARRIAHLDLKPQNLLLHARTHDLCICDFGISRAIRPGAIVREILGTRDYVAPEILSYEPISLAADMWSVGVLAYVLLSGYSPFAGSTKQETYLNIAQCALTFPEELFDDVSRRAHDFIRATLVLDPKGRLTVEQCLEHPWLQDNETYILRAIGDTCEEETHTHETNGTNGVDDSSEDENSEDATKTNGANGIDAGDEGSEEREKASKHPHERDSSPPFPDAPSTPKVSRKSSPTHAAHAAPSVLALCKKFQPDFPERGASVAVAGVAVAAVGVVGDACACACGYECAECGRGLRPARAALPPDRAIIC